MRTSHFFMVFVISVLLILSACQPVGASLEVTPQPKATATATAVHVEAEVVEVPVATMVEVTEPTATPEVEDPLDFGGLDCGEFFCQVPWPGWLERPIGPGYTQTIDRSYPYASTAGGNHDLHHGVEFINTYGTPVLAAKDGEVVFAGMDTLSNFGPFGGFYGNVVILKHPGLLPDGQDVYTLYGHLLEIYIAVGDQVNTGEVIGKVGATGATDGPHLHFEVRVDVNDYAHTVNPVVWFAPLDDVDQPAKAMLAGLILDQYRVPLAEFPLSLEKLSEDGTTEAYFYPITYYPSRVNAHPLLGENFVIPDLPAGNYRLAFIYELMYEFFFTLEPGSLGYINLELDVSGYD